MVWTALEVLGLWLVVSLLLGLAVGPWIDKDDETEGFPWPEKKESMKL